MTNTIVVNLYGGPGIGKSTLASQLFGKMKYNNINCELVTEFAKELVWEERYNTLKDQVFLNGTQYHKMSLLDGKVDIIVTDSSLLNGILYAPDHYPECFKELIVWEYNQFVNIDVLLSRKKPFSPKGRIHDLKESKMLDSKIRNIVVKYNNGDCVYFENNKEESYNNLYDIVMQKIKEKGWSGQ